MTGASNPAVFKGHNLNFSHIKTNFDKPMVLTADPWGFLQAYLLDKIKNSRGDNKKHYTNAKYFARLANEFYISSKTIELPCSSILSYYGMLNLVKCYLETLFISIEKQTAQHGLSLHNEAKHIRITKKKSKCLSIFSKFCESMQCDLGEGKKLSINDLLKNIPELHNIACNIYKENASFIPISINFMTQKAKIHTYLYSEVNIQEKYNNQNIEKIQKDFDLQNLVQEADFVRYHTKKKKISNLKRKDCWQTNYNKILKLYNNENLASILTRKGYQYYYNTDSNGLHHLCNSFALMFYIGSISRYKPSEIQALLESKDKIFITEAVSLCPAQFLYHLISLITSKICIIPFSSIT